MHSHDSRLTLSHKQLQRKTHSLRSVVNLATCLLHTGRAYITCTHTRTRRTHTSSAHHHHQAVCFPLFSFSLHRARLDLSLLCVAASFVRACSHLYVSPHINGTIRIYVKQYQVTAGPNAAILIPMEKNYRRTI